jgi:hypothetical protein
LLLHLPASPFRFVCCRCGSFLPRLRCIRFLCVSVVCLLLPASLCSACSPPLEKSLPCPAPRPPPGSSPLHLVSGHTSAPTTARLENSTPVVLPQRRSHDYDPLSFPLCCASAAARAPRWISATTLRSSAPLARSWLGASSFPLGLGPRRLRENAATAFHPPCGLAASFSSSALVVVAFPRLTRPPPPLPAVLRASPFLRIDFVDVASYCRAGTQTSTTLILTILQTHLYFCVWQPRQQKCQQDEARSGALGERRQRRQQ